MNALARQNIEVFAHYLFQLAGCPQGRAEEHWRIAERQLNENIFRKNVTISETHKIKVPLR